MTSRFFAFPLQFHFLLTYIAMTTPLKEDLGPRLIILNVTRVENNEFNFLEINCSSSRQSIGNGAEFLVNGLTVEHMSIHDNKCYNRKMEECTIDNCQCVPSDHLYTYKYTNSLLNTELIIGCQMRFADNKSSSLIRVFMSRRFNGTVSDLFDYDVTILTQEKEKNKDKNENNSFMDNITRWIPLMCTVLLVIPPGVILVICLRTKCRNDTRTNKRCRLCKHKDEKEKSDMENMFEDDGEDLDNKSRPNTLLCTNEDIRETHSMESNSSKFALSSTKTSCGSSNGTSDAGTFLQKVMNLLSEEDKNRYSKLMQSSQTENRYFVRTMIVGKQSVGKTCLLRRLLNESICDVTSTDSVDIVVRRCKINIKDGRWIIEKEIDDDKVNRIERAFTQNAEAKNTQYMQKEETTNINVDRATCFYTNETRTDQMISLDKNEDPNECSLLLMSKNDKTNNQINLDTNNEKKESSSFVMPADLMSNVFPTSTGNTPSNVYASCQLWDFAGQKEFYATHQAFLTSFAVYLLVVDMKDDISKQGLNQCFADFQHIGEYVDFWFDSIHCHRTTDKPARDGHVDPPIILVFTGKDKYDKEEDFKKRERELRNQLVQDFGHQRKYQHLQDIFFLSNTKDSENDFQKLRYAIYDAARKMDNWGNAFPLKWIILEDLIEINKNNGQNFIRFIDMVNLAKHPDINILEEEDLLLFLRFQNNVGNIIFFENIRDLIILRPQWLADACQCLVSDRIDNLRLYRPGDWTLFKQHGIISESLITELFISKYGSQFYEQKDDLHKVMKTLDILVKIEDSSYYIMPHQMPISTFDVICKQFGIHSEHCKRTSWLCFKFEFLPPAYFNHLLVWFIKQYKPSKVDDGFALYRGMCMFDIERSGCNKILVTMSTDTIALQVLSFSEQQEGFGTCSDLYSAVTQLIEEINMRYKVKLSFKLHFNCSDGYYHKDTFEYEMLKKCQEYYCIEHTQAHRSEQIYAPWIKNEVKTISEIEEDSSL